jgi:hypothetical protein
MPNTNDLVKYCHIQINEINSVIGELKTMSENSHDPKDIENINVTLGKILDKLILITTTSEHLLSLRKKYLAQSSSA